VALLVWLYAARLAAASADSAALADGGLTSWSRC
jgi:hypothetical protein